MKPKKNKFIKPSILRMCRYTSLLLGFCLSFLYSNTLLGQNASDFTFAQTLTKADKKQSVAATYQSDLTNNTNEVELVFVSLFYFYKTILSSQDQNVCSFHPSCSEYGIKAIKTKGLIQGGIMTFDRLTRCNGLSPRNYEIDYERRKLSDPVK